MDSKIVDQIVSKATKLGGPKAYHNSEELRRVKYWVKHTMKSSFPKCNIVKYHIYITIYIHIHKYLHL